MTTPLGLPGWGSNPLASSSVCPRRNHSTFPVLPETARSAGFSATRVRDRGRRRHRDRREIGPSTICCHGWKVCPDSRFVHSSRSTPFGRVLLSNVNGCGQTGWPVAPSMRRSDASDVAMDEQIGPLAELDRLDVLVGIQFHRRPHPAVFQLEIEREPAAALDIQRIRLAEHAGRR